MHLNVSMITKSKSGRSSSVRIRVQSLRSLSLGGGIRAIRFQFAVKTQQGIVATTLLSSIIPFVTMLTVSSLTVVY